MEEKIGFNCPICGNSDPIYIGVRNNHPYCRKCVSFRGKEVNEPISAPKNADYKLNYRLSKEQKELSKQLVQNYKNKKNSLVKPVCGSPKTRNP